MQFLGAPYPIVKNPRGFLATQTGLNQIKSDLLSLLLTNPGERVMLPDYGIPLKKIIFEPNDPTTLSRVREMIITAIKMWEPRIVVEQIEVSSGIEESSLNSSDLKQDLQHILSIRIIFYDPEEIRELQELRLEVPLSSEGAK